MRLKAHMVASGKAGSAAMSNWTTPSTVGPASRSASMTTSILLATEQGAPNGIAVDDTSVYFATRFSGTIVKVPIGGDAPRVLASSLHEPYAVVVGKAFVYWNDITDKTVVRVAK